MGVAVNVERKTLRPGIEVLELIGAIAMGRDCERVDEEIDKLLSEGVRRVILDLSSVQKVDSAAIGTLVACHARVRGANGVLRLAAAQGMVREVFRITQVDRVVPLYGTTNQAAENMDAASQSA